MQSFYYAHDDSTLINNALGAKPASALVIPARCGTTKLLNLSQDSSANSANPALVGSNLESSGLYAFASDPASRAAKPVLSSVLYGGLFNTDLPHPHTTLILTQGGGFRNLRVEGFGIPEGYGYYGMAQGVTMIATGYVGPAWNQVPNNIPTAGTAVEIDSAKLMRIENVHISDGGMGPGNAAFQCGLDESDPTNAIGGDVANIVFTDSRLDSNPLFFAGASNSDVALRLGNSCHDSVYRNITAYDGAKADVMLHNGNLFGQIHVGSSAVNTAAPNGGLPLITWGTIGATFGLAGVADYGVYATGNTSLSQTRCDIARAWNSG